MKQPLDPSTSSALLGLLTHDLRNPLSALHSNLGYLASVLSDQDEDTREAIVDGLVSCDALAHMIANMDLLARELGGELEADSVSLDLTALVRGEVARAQSLARSHGSLLAMDDEGSRGSLQVQSSAELLGHVVQNLLRNAVQHAPSGSTVRVAVTQRDGKAIVEVRDEGEATHSPEVDVFSARGQIAAKSAPGGRYSRGLGLFAAQIGADAFGGRLSARPDDSGKGNVLTLTLSL